MARKSYNADKNDSQPKEAVQSYCVDLGSVNYLPKLSVGEVFYKRQLSEYPCYIVNLKSNDVFVCCWDETVAGRGPNEINSCLLKVLQVQSENGRVADIVNVWFDNCGGQNKSQFNAAFGGMICENKMASEVNFKFLELGDTFNACDQAAGVAERKIKKKKSIETSAVLHDVIKGCRTEQPYSLIELTQNDMFDFKKVSAEKIRILQRQDNNGDKLKFREIRQMKFTVDNPRTLHFKYTFFPDEPFKSVSMNRRRTRPHSSTLFRQLVPAYASPRLISKAKHEDLLHLSKFLKPENRDFYKNLAYNGQAETGDEVEVSNEPQWEDDSFVGRLDEFAPPEFRKYLEENMCSN